MQIRKLDSGTFAACVAEAAEVLRAGGVIVFPTDTLYGLGADALSDEAVEKIARIKGRDENKPIHAIVSDTRMMARYAEINPGGKKLAEKFFPGPLTIIFKKRERLISGIAKHIATIGIRIPDNDFCIEMARAFDGPVTATSANRAGEVPQRSLNAILAQLGDAAQEIDLVFDAGELPSSLPSTVIDVSKGEMAILREGAIPAADIWEVVRAEE